MNFNKNLYKHLLPTYKSLKQLLLLIMDLLFFPAAPPHGYTYLPHSAYYKFHPQHVNWQLASYTCQEEGGHLVVFNSEAEAKFVSGLWNSPTLWAYIGTHDLFEEGTYVTIYSK